jgi:hypothetical protein
MFQISPHVADNKARKGTWQWLQSKFTFVKMRFKFAHRGDRKRGFFLFV